MNTLPLSINTIHFVGIGGIGMSGIAEVLHNLGYAVQGSDIAENPNVRRLMKLGIRVFVGHDAKNIDDAQIVVVSTAIRNENPEIQAARARLIPVVHRSEMLGELGGRGGGGAAVEAAGDVGHQTQGDKLVRLRAHMRGARAW